MRFIARVVLLIAIIAVVVLLVRNPAHTPTNSVSVEGGEPQELSFSIARGDTTYYGATSSNVGVAILGVGSSQFLGDGFGEAERADGKFIVITVAIFNQQRDAITMDSNLFEILDSNDVVYSASEKSIWLGGDNLFLARINPGVRKVGRIAFDVPENLALNNLRLRFRGGMTGEAALLPLRVNSVTSHPPAPMEPEVQPTGANSPTVQSSPAADSGSNASTEQAVSAEVGGQAGSGLYHVGGSVSAPVSLNAVEVEFTDEARRAKHQGVCLVSMIVDEQGNPQNPRVVRGLGMGLDEKALEAVRKYRFRPAMMDGRQPVPVMITVEVNFRLY